MASREMTPEQVTRFLSSASANLVAHATDGSIHFICMDWRHMREMLDAGAENYLSRNHSPPWPRGLIASWMLDKLRGATGQACYATVRASSATSIERAGDLDAIAQYMLPMRFVHA
jgi:hypothetical protein